MNSEIIERAEMKYSIFKTLKEDICLSLTSINDQITDVKRKIQENLVSKENQNGVLTGDVEDYLACLGVDKVQLNRLLREDEAYWIEKIKNSKKETEERNGELQAFIKDQNKKLQEILSRQHAMAQVQEIPTPEPPIVR